jgi:DNA replication protein DnaC
MTVNYLKQKLPPGRTGHKTFQQAVHQATEQNKLPNSSTKSGVNGPSIQLQPDCPICNDTGRVRLDVVMTHPMFGKLVLCECKYAEHVARLQELSRIMPGERNIRLTDINPDAGSDTRVMVEMAKEFLNEPIGIFTICGTTGNAKSTTLLAIVNEMVQARCMAVYVTAFDLFGYVRAAFDNGNNVLDESAYERLKKFERVEVLAIDEFDAVRQTDWVTEQIIDLVDTRHRLGLDGLAGTIIAMNKSVDDLPPRVSSRLKDGQNKLCVNRDPDMRPMLQR